MDIRDLNMDAIADRFGLTFARENHDRPLLYLSFPNGQPLPPLPPPPPTPPEKWFAFDWQLDCFEKHLTTVGFMAEGFPAFGCNLGPDILTGFTGSELDFSDPHTTWAKPRVTNWAEEPPLRFQRDGYLWQAMERFLRLSAERGQGRWLTSSGDLHSNGDALSALRSPEALLMDLIEQPEEIHKRLREMHEVLAQVLEAHFQILHPRSNGMNTSWLPATCRGRFAIVQNDFCCMISPEMFDDFFKEYVFKETELLDHAIYHLDGPGAIRHLDSICEAPGVDVIQWVPGAGEKSSQNEWPDLLRRIQALGKGLWLEHMTPRQALELMDILRPEGAMYAVRCESREEAERFLREVERLHSAQKKVVPP